jgi:hypothetical protein
MVASIRVSLALCALLVLGGATESLGQQFTGNIRGSVRDADGVIPGATVTLSEAPTSRAHRHQPVGEYNFPALPSR